MSVITQHLSQELQQMLCCHKPTTSYFLNDTNAVTFILPDGTILIDLSNNSSTNVVFHAKIINIKSGRSQSPEPVPLKLVCLLSHW